MRFMAGLGISLGSHSRTKHHLHQAFVEGSSSQDDGNRSRFREGRNVRNMPKPADFRVWGDSKRDGSQGMSDNNGKLGKVRDLVGYVDLTSIVCTLVHIRNEVAHVRFVVRRRILQKTAIKDISQQWRK